ncbi:MAG TPA: ATPase, T2SS/T4P/T4SS family [Candidatus Baltobacteraceae bacterium]|jgi:Flp pilus assembly CpaF family ATPase/MinD-like ATPase involved in chromosome partitioning or flagellar assembly
MKSAAFVFIGAKGGVGTSTLAYELAKSLTNKGNAALVDADFSGRRSVAVLSGKTRELDASRSEREVAVHRSGGLTTIELTDSYDMALALNLDAVDQLADELAEGYALIYVDAPQPFSAAIRSFVCRAYRFLIVVEPDLLGLTGARAMLNELVRFGVPKTRIVAVMDWHVGKPEISKNEVEKILGTDVVAEIPPKNDRQFHRAVEALNAYLLAVPEAGPIESLKPSVRAPLSERRRENRRVFSLNDPLMPANQSHAVRDVDAGEAARNAIKTQIHDELGKRLDFVQASHVHNDAQKLAELRVKIDELTRSIIAERSDVGSPEDSTRLRREVIDEALGFGPLEDLLSDESISEIMVNGPNKVYVERKGKIELTSKQFTDNRQLRLVIDRIIAPIGRRIDESVPMVDARLADGSRVNAIIEPLSLKGPTLTIRRFGTKRLQVADLLRLGALNEPMVHFLRACIQSRMNIVVSGGTGSGKTTLLNILSGFIPPDERIVTIEDAAELLLDQPHVVSLESRPANIEDRGEVKIRDLVRNSLRMRPDRIVVGECRGAEALDMLQAMNTGHDGSLTTLHANSARDAMSRIETLVMMAGFDLPVRAIREQIASAVDLVVQSARLRDGSRKIVSICEIVGMEGDVVTMQEVVKYTMHGVNEDGSVIGKFEYTGVQPHSLRRFDESGTSFDTRELSEMPSAGALW